MASMFAPKMPDPQKPQLMPQIDQAMVQANQQQDILRRRGAGTTILTGDSGVSSLGAVGKPSVTGSK